MRVLAAILGLFVGGCVGVPENVTPVRDFDAERYLGRWYEIARLENRFERGLERVTAEYVARDDGCIDVINRGFKTETGEWKEARGKACFVGERTVGHLKVSFFGPFYGSYIVADLDHDNYSWALVTGAKTSWLWILSRTPEMSRDVYDSIVATADSLGFDTAELLRIPQGRG